MAGKLKITCVACVIFLWNSDVRCYILIKSMKLNFTLTKKEKKKGSKTEEITEFLINVF